MRYHIIFAPSFEIDVQDKIDWLRQQNASEHVIEAWFEKLYWQIDHLADWPRIYPVDPRYTDVVGYETWKISFKVHLVFYQVDDRCQEIHVVAFMHGATRPESAP